MGRLTSHNNSMCANVKSSFDKNKTILNTRTIVYIEIVKT